MPKLGPHCTGSIDWSNRALVVKLFHSGTSTADTSVFAAAPNNSYRVFRHYFDSQPYHPGAGIEAATTVIAALNGYRHPRLFVELYNEPNQADIGPLCQMIQEAVPVLHAAGLRVAAFSWGTGQPELSVWQYVRDSWDWCGLDPAVDAIALHEYSNNYQIDGWNMGRYQQLVDFDPRWSILITETGFDNGGTNTNGWRANGNNLAQYNALLTQYDLRIAACPQILGATVFQTGLAAWSSFEYSDPSYLFTAPEVLAERAYNAIATGWFIPGVQYVQANSDGAYITVVTFSSLTAAENAYNTIANGLPFIANNRYVQNDGDGTYRVVVSFPLL